MKYLITILILLTLCISANAQVTAGNDEKATGATIGMCKGYSYEVTYTIVDGKVLPSGTEKSVFEKIDTGKNITRVKADRFDKPAGRVDNFNKEFCYEVTYTIANGNVIQTDSR